MNTESIAPNPSPKPSSSIIDRLWTNRNAMQRTGAVGLAGGLGLGLIGVPTAVVTLSSIGCGVFYGTQTRHKGFKKHALAVSAVVLSMVSLTIGGSIGSSISGREWLPSDASSTASYAPPSSSSTPAPPVAEEARASLTESVCVAQQGRSIAAAESALGAGKRMSSTAGNEFMPATQMYQFGNAFGGGACTIMFQNGKAATATFTQF